VTDYPQDIIDAAALDGIVFALDHDGRLLIAGSDKAKRAWLPVVQVIADDIAEYIGGAMEPVTLERCRQALADEVEKMRQAKLPFSGDAAEVWLECSPRTDLLRYWYKSRQWRREA
jgi:hypothetical protein